MRVGGPSLFPLALLGAMAALTFWLERATQIGVGTSDGKSRHDPDYIVDNLKARRFGPDGLLQNTVVAQRMIHYADDDSTEVLAPRITYHRNPPTLLIADTARMDKDGKHVRLEGNVNVTRGGGNGVTPTNIATTMLDIVPDDEYARTDAPVTITKDKSIVTGIGAEVDNKRQTAVLFGPVRGTIHKKAVAPAPAALTREPTQNETPTSAARPAPPAGAKAELKPVATPAASAAAKPAAKPVAKPAARPKSGARGKGGQGQTRKSGSGSHHRR